MKNKSMNEKLCSYLQEIMENPETASLDRSFIPETHKKLVGVIDTLLQQLLESNRFCRTLQGGCIYKAELPPADNVLAQPAKSVYSTLKYLLDIMNCIRSGNYERRMMIVNDISLSFNDMVDQLMDLSAHDALTGMWQTEAFDEKAQELLQGKDTGSLYYVVYFQLVHYTTYKAMGRREEGNQYLMAFADFLKHLCRSGEICAHIHEDRFACLFKDTSLETLLQRLQEAELRCPVEGSNAAPRFKCGLYVVQHRDIPVCKMREYAAFACENDNLQVARDYAVFDELQFRRFMTHCFFLKQFNTAVRDGDIKLYYQPQVETKTGNVVSCAAVTRWVRPEGKLAMPEEYLPVLRKYDLLEDLNLYMLRQVCQHLRTRLQQHLPVVPVSVDFSAFTFIDKALLRQLCSILNKYGIEGKLISLELSSSVLQNEYSGQQVLLRYLHRCGFRIVLHHSCQAVASDALCTGRPIDAVAFSMASFQTVDKNEQTKKIMKNMLGLMRDLQFTTVATDVDTARAASFLKSNGCDRIQGAYFFEPLAETEFGKILGTTGFRL